MNSETSLISHLHYNMNMIKTLCYTHRMRLNKSVFSYIYSLFIKQCLHYKLLNALDSSSTTQQFSVELDFPWVTYGAKKWKKNTHKQIRWWLAYCIVPYGITIAWHCAILNFAFKHKQHISTIKQYKKVEDKLIAIENQVTNSWKNVYTQKEIQSRSKRATVSVCHIWLKYTQNAIVIKQLDSVWMREKVKIK